MAKDSPIPSRAPNPGRLSLLITLGAIAMLLHGAVLFNRTMSHQVVQVALQVALSDQLNTATFLARELVPPTGPLAEPTDDSDPVARYAAKFEHFTMRHSLRAYVVDVASFEALIKPDIALPTEATFLPPLVYAQLLGEGPLSRALTVRRKVQGFVTIEGERYVTSLVPIPGTTHTVVVYRSEAPIIAAATELTQRFTGYLIAAFAIVLVIFSLFMRKLTQPLRVLTQAALEIGRGRLEQEVPVNNNTEVGLLAEAFNQMSRELRVKYRELASSTQRLEDSNRRYRDILSEYERQNAELMLLNTLVFEASRATDAEHNLEFLAARIQDSFQLSLVAYFAWHPRYGWTLEQATHAGFNTGDFERGGLQGELERLAIHHKIRLLPADCLGLAAASPLGAALAGHRCCLVPVMVQGVLEAAFVLVAPTPAAFSRMTIQRFTRLTNQLGIILHKDALLAETLRRREQLEQINRLGQALLTELDFDRLIPRLLTELNSFLKSDEVVLSLLEPGGLEPVMAVDATGPVPPALHYRETSWNQQVQSSGMPVLIRDYPPLNLWTPEGAPLETSRINRFRSYLAVPLREGGRVLGVLAFLAEQPETFNEDDVQFLETFANQLTAAIVSARLFQEIRARDERRNVQLATAKQFQADRIPTSFEEGGIEARITLQPAEELAGDFFDVFRLSPNVTGLVIGDVATKGVAASLLTFSMLSIFRNYATSMSPPAKVMTQANETIRAQLKADFWFVTAFYARINRADLTMTYCKAGHVLPVLYHATDGTCELLDGEGLPLGILDDAEYIGAQVDLTPGDRLILYTDGVTELKNDRNEQFGSERLSRLIASFGHESPDQLRARILAALDQWSPVGSRDDILVAVVGLLEDPWISQVIRYDDMEDLIEKVMAEVRSFPVDTKVLYAIRLALNETIANAYLHGNAGDATAPIEIAYLLTDSYFALTLRDTGIGYDYENLPDPTVPENVIRTHGRGIFLLRQMMDEIEFNAQGNEVRVKKWFTPDRMPLRRASDPGLKVLPEGTSPAQELGSYPLIGDVLREANARVNAEGVSAAEQMRALTGAAE